MSILPYVEQTALANQLDAKRPWDAEENRKPVSAVLSIYQCPSYAGNESGLNHTHYVGLSGLGADAAILDKDHPSAGFFGYTRQISSKDIKDGMSSTIAIMESNVNNGPWAAGGPPTLRNLLLEETSYVGEFGPFGMKHKTDTFFRTNPVVVVSAFADATVRPISADVLPETLRALVTIAGGDDVGPDF